MRVFICWLINVSDWIGEISLWMMLAMSANYFEKGDYSPLFGAVAAIIPAFVTAIYAAINYELVLSWAIIRWTSPLNLFTNRIFYFLKTLILSGAAWAALIAYLARRWFPNESFEWVIPFVKSIYHWFV